MQLSSTLAPALAVYLSRHIQSRQRHSGVMSYKFTKRPSTTRNSKSHSQNLLLTRFLFPSLSRYGAAWITGGIDTLRSQAQTHSIHSPIRLFYNTIQLSGIRTALKGIYAPVPALALKDASKGGSRFLSQTLLEDPVYMLIGISDKHTSTKHEKLLASFISGYLGSVTIESILTAPMETAQIFKSSADLKIKTLSLTLSNLSKDSPHYPDLYHRQQIYKLILHQPARHTLQKVYSTMGLAHSLSGFLPLAKRNGLFSGSMFLGMEISNQVFGERPLSTSGQLLHAIQTGAISTTLSVFGSIIPQVIQTRVASKTLEDFVTLTQYPTAPRQHTTEFQKIALSIREIWALPIHNRLHVFFSGVTLKWVRQSLNQILFFYFLGQLNDTYKTFNS